MIKGCIKRAPFYGGYAFGQVPSNRWAAGMSLSAAWVGGSTLLVSKLEDTIGHKRTSHF